MKIFNFIIILIIVGFFSILIFFYAAFSGTTWGGWTPPDVSLKLNDNESKWVENIENKYEVIFDYIGLDNGYTEDSIIYITLNCNNKSTLDKNKITNKEKFVKELCKQFFHISENKRTQNYIKFSFDNLKVKNEFNPVNTDFLFYKKLDSIVKLE
jgi:hypothetical protein